MDTLEGTVERVTYYSEESGYTVLRLAPAQPTLGRGDQLITVVGTMPEVQPGENLKCTGSWTTHPDYGRQFKAEKVVQQRPATVEGIRRYLSSNLIKGVGPVTAKRIVDFFGDQTLDILDHEPERVREVPGVGRHRAGIIEKAWEEQKAVKEVMLFLQSYGLNTGIATRIYQTYKDDALDLVQQNPYRLVEDIWGVGFLTADRLARALGIAPQSPNRLKAGIAYALSQAENDGHVYLPTDELVALASELLGVEPGMIEEMLHRIQGDNQIRLDDVRHPEKGEMMQAVYRAPVFYSERNTAERIFDMLDSPASRLTRISEMTTDQFDALLERILNHESIRLSEQQQRAVRASLTSKITILTGGPGTGKTTTLRTIIAMLAATGHSFKLASPTGRAAKRLNEATGYAAQTIHRLLSYNPREGWGANDENPLNTDMVVVDEASMIDLQLFYALVKAIRPETHLLLVGDVDQLPSVGAGDVLRDLIRSHVCTVIELDTIFRQASDSMIIDNAHRINRGKMPDTSNSSSDFFFFGAEDAEEAAALLVDIVKARVPQKFGFDAVNDIQVLAPMYRGAVGVENLNEALQAALNPNPDGRKIERRLSGTLFRIGDKVLQTRNNYDKDVFNGDIGRVHSFNMEEQVMRVDVDGRLVDYDFSECDELTLAYAISVHKSQGSEYPVVVMPVHTQHFMMLQRNLLYTGVTRAKQMVVLVGTRKALGISVRNDVEARRYTALDSRLSV
ncbi:MAG: ATP-dependent RecD-like DNA helicase [Chloroflexi bacterium]|nr:ATP-dependent RecD-like DNA helicase [Chloroflexota bacterium]